ncbi:MAG: hypothetical protein HWQ38_38100 [Nostoc sp. NMS7]|uniref:hypothetical protein n=1 Tax=Nostoc sp. NMS7 TaxID=2815391 RepID=UPI0025D5D228|nr:hypothetical protein [Nostoc sp. NMS7]MBN3951970.1 hypothetical protein [Nostoc sp. NMS7]
MKESRNPFRMRASEQSESDDNFVRLFSSRVLDILGDSTEGLFDRLRIFISAPGGGKTSLLRLFTPNALLTIRTIRERSNDTKDLFQ